MYHFSSANRHYACLEKRVSINVKLYFEGSKNKIYFPFDITFAKR